MANRPQKDYGIAHSPVGLAGSIMDHIARSYELMRVFDGKPEGLTREDILENIHSTGDGYGDFFGSSVLGI